MPSKLKGHRKNTLGRWFHGYGKTQTEPGVGSVNVDVGVNVPFKHRLIAAKWASESVEITTGIVLSIRYGLVGGIATVTTITTADTLVDGVDVNAVGDFVLETADRSVVHEVGTRYYIRMTGIHADDLLKGPMLSVLVEPLDARTAL